LIEAAADVQPPAVLPFSGLAPAEPIDSLRALSRTDSDHDRAPLAPDGRSLRALICSLLC